MEKIKKLSVALAVFNEENNLDACLTSVRDFAGEIVIVDGGSTDKTPEIAAKYNAKIVKTDNPPIFHINKQKALEACSGEWILQLDADEVVTDDLKKEINSLIRSGNTDFNGYYVPRKNFFLGKWLSKGGQYPDYVIRLFKNGYGRFPARSVHEQIEIMGSIGYLKNPLLHYSYKNLRQYWQKADVYINLTARSMTENHESKALFNALDFILFKPIIVFVKISFRHKGIIDGWRGILFAFFSSLHYPLAYIKYLFKKYKL